MVYFYESASKYPEYYLFRDQRCLGCVCFSPGIRVRKSWDKRRRDKSFGCCTIMIDSACPQDVGYNVDTFTQRYADGWKMKRI